MNKTIKLLMLSDIFILTGFGLIQPVLAIYLNNDIVGGSIFAAGFASSLFLIMKCLVQLPFSFYVDKIKIKKELLIVGAILTALVPIIYLSSNDIYGIYLAEIIYGIGSGLAYPTWLSLWSRHLDKNKEGFEWTLYATVTGLGTAGTASIGALVADKLGFSMAFVFVSIMAAIGTGILFFLDKKNKTL